MATEEGRGAKDAALAAAPKPHRLASVAAGLGIRTGAPMC